MTQEPYTVSILVPVYGVEKYIERCARSIFGQTYKNLDIVFVDGCTPDNITMYVRNEKVICQEDNNEKQN